MQEPSVHELFDLSGQVALISGASGYLGSAMARALAEAGARVVVTSRVQGRAEQVAAALPAAEAGPHVPLVLDQLDELSVEKAFGQAVERTGRIDILVNNGHEASARDWTDVTAAEFSRQLGNATGYFLLARLVRNHAVACARPASIILIGSMYGVVGCYPHVYDDLGPVSPAAYHALKGALVHMARHLAVLWAEDRVRVNCLSPGPFPNPATVPAGLTERLATKTPMGRMGTPPELKGPLLLLASRAGSYLTGQNLIVDGGWTAW